MKKLWSKILLTVCIVGIFSACLVGCGNYSAKRTLSIVTGNISGTYYPIGSGIAKILNRELDDVDAKAQPSDGSIANVNMLKENQADMAIIQNDIAYYAVEGIEMFAGNKVSDLRGMMILYPEPCQCVVLDYSGTRSFDDLRGKRVAVGKKNTGSETNVRQVLAIYGISYDDIEPLYLDFNEGTKALVNGNCDAVFVTAGQPTAAIKNIANSTKIRLLSLDDEHIKKLTDKFPFFTKMTIPAGTYHGFDESVTTVSVMATLVATDKMDTKLGYELTKEIFNNLGELQKSHAVGQYITKENALQGMSITVQAGAEKFFR